MKLIKDCKEIIIVYLLQVLLIVLFSLFSRNINQLYYVMVVFYIVLIIYFVKNNKYNDKSICFDNVFVCLYFVLSLAIIINMLFFLVGFQNSNVISINLLLLIFSSGIIGPIVEELLFRNILLNRLLLRYSSLVAIVLSSFIFGLFHGSINGFIYAFIIGLCLSFIYYKYRNIKLCILCHMVSNIFILFLYRFNIYILLLAILCFVISNIIILKFKTIKC